jgi:hypothetical protein
VRNRARSCGFHYPAILFCEVLRGSAGALVERSAGPLEVRLGHLQVMLLGDPLGVTDPGDQDVARSAGQTSQPAIPDDILPGDHGVKRAAQFATHKVGSRGLSRRPESGRMAARHHQGRVARRVVSFQTRGMKCKPM